MPDPIRPDREPHFAPDFQAAADLAAAAARARVRVRFTAQLYHFGPAQRYKHWRGVQFMLDLDPSVEEAHALYEALDAAFEAVSTLGSLETARVLRAAVGQPSPALPLGPERPRVHACPVCGLACDCAKGWAVLDADKSLELHELAAGQCDCKHQPAGELGG